MDNTKEQTTVSSQPADMVAPVHDSSSTTPAPDMTNNATPATEAQTLVATPATEEQIQPLRSDDPAPPKYEQHDKEVTQAPAQAAVTPSYPPHEKTAWQSATQASVPQPGQQVPYAQRVVDLTQLTEDPRIVICPFCYQEGLTRVQKESTSATGLAAVGCCLVGGICLAFLPFCMEMCHDCHHFCSKCGQKVAIFPHDGSVQIFAPHPPVIAAAPEAVQPPKAAVVTHDSDPSVKH